MIYARIGMNTVKPGRGSVTSAKRERQLREKPCRRRGDPEFVASGSPKADQARNGVTLLSLIRCYQGVKLKKFLHLTNMAVCRFFVHFS
jgi:hypothetical protein